MYFPRLIQATVLVLITLISHRVGLTASFDELIEQGNRLNDGGDLVAAYELYLKARTLARGIDEIVTAEGSLAASAFQSKRYEAAIKHLYEVLSVDPDNRWADEFRVKLAAVNPAGITREEAAEIYVQLGHDVAAMAISPSGRYLATSDGDRQIKIWDIETTREIQTLISDVNELCFLNDTILAVANFENKIANWNAFEANKLRIIESKETGKISALDCSSDGQHIAVIGEQIAIWNVNKAIKTNIFTYTIEGITFAKLSPDSHHLLLGGTQGLHLIDAITGRIVRKFSKTVGKVFDADFSSDSKQIIAGDEAAVKRWDVQTGALVKTYQEIKENNEYRAVRFSPNGKYIFADFARKYVIFDTKTGNVIKNNFSSMPGWAVTRAIARKLVL